MTNRLIETAILVDRIVRDRSEGFALRTESHVAQAGAAVLDLHPGLDRLAGGDLEVDPREHHLRAGNDAARLVPDCAAELPRAFLGVCEGAGARVAERPMSAANR